MKNSGGKKKQIKPQVWTHILRFILRQTKKKIRIANLVKCRIVCTFLDFCVFVLICHAHSNNWVDVTSWQLTGLEYLNTDLVVIKQQYGYVSITCFAESVFLLTLKSTAKSEDQNHFLLWGCLYITSNKCIKSEKNYYFFSFQLLYLWSFARGRGRGAGENGQRIFVLCT